jgi:biopolymer transport protein ExbD
MARRSRTQVEQEDIELNMTPMLDVVFILLIFFIVTSVFVKTPGIDPTKPEAVTDVDWNPGILIAVNSDSEVWIDKRPYDITEVRPILLTMRDENPKAEAIVIGDQNAEAGTVMQVVDIMADLNISTRVSTQ